MRRTLILTIAALTGLLLVWLIVVRVPEPPAPAAKPVVHAPAPAVAPPAEAPVAPKPEEPPVKPVAETKPPEPKPAVPPPPASETTHEDAEAQAEDTADDSTDSENDEDSGPPEIDTDHATDLIADLIASEENATETDHLPNAVVQTLKKFDQESADANWSENAQQHIEATLDAWIAALPADAQAHLALIHVECRATLCQVLAADNDPGTADERSQAGHEWQQAILSLPQQPWWHELGFVDSSTQVSGADEHTLYISYLLREVKTSPAPDAPPDTGETGTTDGG